MTEKKEATGEGGKSSSLAHGKDTELIDFDLEDFEAETDKLISDLCEAKGLFLVKSANKWMQEASRRPIPKMLFDAFWFQGEVCILFADTNLGKSILAVQIGEAISKGFPINGFKTNRKNRKFYISILNYRTNNLKTDILLITPSTMFSMTISKE